MGESKKNCFKNKYFLSKGSNSGTLFDHFRMIESSTENKMAVRTDNFLLRTNECYGRMKPKNVTL